MKGCFNRGAMFAPGQPDCFGTLYQEFSSKET
jgi:hypothetical protein